MGRQNIDRVATLLVVCGYAKDICVVDDERRDEYGDLAILKEAEPHWQYKVDPYSDTLESRRQEEALENFFAWHEREMWDESDRHVICGEAWGVFSMRARRLGRIRWCVNQMIENDELISSTTSA